MLKNENKKHTQDQSTHKTDEKTKKVSSDTDNTAEKNASADDANTAQENQPSADAQTENSKMDKNTPPQLDADTKDLIIKDLQDKNNELNDKYLRLFSEFDNFRKRNIRERAELISTASADMIKEVLPILDDLERAFKSAVENPEINALTEGVGLILTKLKTTLRNKGVEEIQTTGQVFDTDYHEAITHIPSPNEEDKGKVIEEIKKGYTLNGKVVRFAQVVVAN